MQNLLKTEAIITLINLAIAEDIYTGDITSDAILTKNQEKTAYLIAKAHGVIVGLPLAEFIFKKIDATITFEALVKEGDLVKQKTKLAKIVGNFKSLLEAERIVLNFIQRLSGIATLTSQYVAQIKDTKTKILDTRKTLPGFRLLDKYAVKIGGGTNHRMGLYDMVMLKENHIEVAGGITKAIAQVRKAVNQDIKIEVETRNIKEVREALNNHVDVIMLDNMGINEMHKAIGLINGQIKVEASGNMTLERIAEVAATGVDLISVGALTHSVTALDISMLIV